MINYRILDKAPINRGRRSHRLFLPMVVMVIVLAYACLMSSPEAEGQSPTIDYTIRMEKAEVILDVRPGQMGTANNTVIIDNHSIHSLTIHIQSNCGGGISVTPIAATMGLPTSGKSELHLAISALPNTTPQRSDCSVQTMVANFGCISTPDPVHRSTGFRVNLLAPNTMVEIEIDFIEVEEDPYSGWSLTILLESIILMGLVATKLRLSRRSEEWLSPDLVRRS